MNNKPARLLAAISIGLMTATSALGDVEKSSAKEPAYKSMNSNKPAAGKLNSEDLKMKVPDKLTSKEPASSGMNSDKPDSTVKLNPLDSANKGMNSNKPAAGKLNSEDLKMKVPDKLSSKEPAAGKLNSEDLKMKVPDKLTSKEPAMGPAAANRPTPTPTIKATPTLTSSPTATLIKR